MKAKAQRESLARLAIQDPGQLKVWSEAEQQNQFKEAQIEATNHHQPQQDTEQLKLLCNMYVGQAEHLGKSTGTVKEAEPIHPNVSAEQQKQLKEAQIEATIHNQLLLWSVAKQFGMVSNKKETCSTGAISPR